MEELSTNLIQWYPGHIAKARRQLQEQLKQVDLVLEVLDARIPLASRHSELLQLIGDRPRLVILNRSDMIPAGFLRRWVTWFESHNEQIFPTNSQDGEGVKAVLKAAHQGGIKVNERRVKRGMRPRSVRVAVVGFPNVGKSALINRMVGKRVVASAAKPGVTRQLRWVRIGEDIDLLDSPGILPPRIDDQIAAARLAICDDIGQAAYVASRVALVAYEILSPLVPKRLNERFGVEVGSLTGESWLEAVAEKKYQGNIERAADHLLLDFRKGQLGRISLETPAMAPPAAFDAQIEEPLSRQDSVLEHEAESLDLS
ncbi:MAG: ribosome biogenesis GTPase YlqF [Anaerolineae bacterium]|nr:ribosome biogenesis GTPase YlqF [Gloeobacterales cyanobacterium ES-bin-313]